MQDIMNLMGNSNAERFVRAWKAEVLQGFKDSYITQKANGTEILHYTTHGVGDYIDINSSENSEISLGKASTRGAEVIDNRCIIGSGRRLQQNGETDGKGGFLGNNWQDVAFMSNDLAPALGNNSSLSASFSPTDWSKKEGFINGSAGIGVGIGAFCGVQFQNTIGAIPIWQW